MSDETMEGNPAASSSSSTKRPQQQPHRGRRHHGTASVRLSEGGEWQLCRFSVSRRGTFRYRLRERPKGAGEGEKRRKEDPKIFRSSRLDSDGGSVSVSVTLDDGTDLKIRPVKPKNPSRWVRWFTPKSSHVDPLRTDPAQRDREVVVEIVRGKSPKSPEISSQIFRRQSDGSSLKPPAAQFATPQSNSRVSPTTLRRTLSEDFSAGGIAGGISNLRRSSRILDESFEPTTFGDEAKDWYSKCSGEPMRNVSKQWRNSMHASAVGGTRLLRPTSKRRRRRTQFKVNVMGEVIYKGHPSWVLMHQMQIGLRHAVGEQRLTPDQISLLSDSQGCRTRPEFYDTAEVVRFPAVGSEGTEPHDLGDFKFKDYCPLAFRYLRALFGVSKREYLESLCHSTARGQNPLRLMSTPGKSGSLFFFSNDMRFVVKTIPKDEAIILRSILQPYVEHVSRNPETLLPRFYGLYRVKPHRGRQVRFVVMANLFATGLKVDERFDLKGSTLGRYVPPEERARKPNATLKEVNLKEMHKTFGLGSANKKALIDQLLSDCEMLCKAQLMDYSLLVGVHRPAPPSASASHQHPLAATPLRPQQMMLMRASRDAEEEPATDEEDSDITPVSSMANLHESWTTAPRTPVVAAAPPPPVPSSLVAAAGATPATPTTTTTTTTKSEFLPFTPDLQPKAGHTRKASTQMGELDVVSLPVWDNFDDEYAYLNPLRLPTARWFTEDGGIAERDESGRPTGGVYFLGIIDILMLYSLRKVVERAYKTIRYRGQGEISSCPPEHYAARFLDFIDGVVR